MKFQAKVTNPDWLVLLSLNSILELEHVKD